MMLAAWLVSLAIAAMSLLVSKQSPSGRPSLGMIAARVGTVLIPSGISWTRWAVDNGPYVPNDIGVARLGPVLRPDLVLILLDRPEVESYGDLRGGEWIYLRRKSRAALERFSPENDATGSTSRRRKTRPEGHTEMRSALARGSSCP